MKPRLQERQGSAGKPLDMQRKEDWERMCRLLVDLPMHAWLSHLKHAGHLYEDNGFYVQSMQQHCGAQPTVQGSTSS